MKSAFALAALTSTLVSAIQIEATMNDNDITDSNTATVKYTVHTEK